MQEKSGLEEDLLILIFLSIIDDILPCFVYSSWE